ncbi:MAG: sigma-70 family RNA polymerase sigma factor [Planctomycetota bacterium]
MEASDHELLERYRRGDARAMDVLVDRHAATVYAFVFRFHGDPTLAEDLTQEVWLKVIRHAGSFEGRSRFTTWVYRIARNVCLDHLRHRQRHPDLARSEGDPFALEELEAGGAPPLERASRKELAAQVADAVASLPERQREVFLLREQQELTFTEIADVLEVPRETVKSRMRYALGHIRRALRRGEVTRGL